MTKKNYRQKHSLNLDGSASQMVVTDNVARNIKYHEIAKDFVNNGCRQTLAYSNVTKQPYGKCSAQATRLFRKPFMVDLIRAYIVGDHEVPRTKDWAIKKWTEMVQTNVLNYVNDDGEYLSIAELRLLPAAAQEAIKKLTVTTKEVPIKVKGEIVEVGGLPLMTIVQKVEIELIDKQKALSDLARAEKWIETHMNINITAPVSADTLIDAQMRIQKRIQNKAAIEGTAEVIE